MKKNKKTLLTIITIDVIMLTMISIECNILGLIISSIVWTGVLVMLAVYRKTLICTEDLEELNDFHCLIAGSAIFVILEANHIGRDGVMNIVTALYIAGLLLCGRIIIHYR